jgi:ribonuclease E
MSESPDGSTSSAPLAAPSAAPDQPRPAGKSNSVITSQQPSLADGVSAEAANRRRGSRGGRKRRSGSPAGSVTDTGIASEPGSGQTPLASDPQRGTVDSEYDRRPADLPDSPFEGVPSPEAAARAEVRPRIGDSRPARVANPPTSDAMVEQQDSAETPGPRTGNPRKNRRGGRSKAGRGEGAQASQGADSTSEPSDGTPRGPRPSRSQRIAAALDEDSPVELDSSQGTKDNRSPRRNGQKSEKVASAHPMMSALNDAQSEEGSRKGRRGGNTPKTRGRNGSGSTAEVVERPRGRERNGRPVGRFLMCVHAHPKATQIAVLEGRSLIEHYVSRPTDSANQIHGNIYLGRVQNVLPGMEAAFVDIGTPKNAVVYRGDLQFDAGDIESSGKKKDDVRIEQVLKNRQLVLCQVTKNPIGSKGARLTQDVSIPGRFVVLVPNSDTYGISKRLGDDERKRLRRILDEIRPENHGLIVRTAAEGATPDELRRDVALLLRQWEAIEAKAKKANSPMLLHKEPDMAVRVIREEFNQNYRGIVIDDRELYEEVRSYVESISPELADRVEFHDSSVEPLPLFEKHHVHEQLHKAIDRKVWLPSGGSLIIERTEALTVIDVNTGKNVGSSSLEETVFRNNLEAADEIARQLRLRDIGGIVVIDFIDMEIRANREAVIGTFRDALSRDKTRTQVFDISELGLVEMTRKRISEGLVESLSEGCPVCAGRGFTFDSDLID